MTPTAAPAPPPVEHIAIDESGAARVKGTRIRVSLIVTEFHAHGRTPAQIAEDYTTLAIADVYAALAYYEDNRAVIDAERAEEKRICEEARREQAERDPGLRERLLARLAERGISLE